MCSSIITVAVVQKLQPSLQTDLLINAGASVDPETAVQLISGLHLKDFFLILVTLILTKKYSVASGSPVYLVLFICICFYLFKILFKVVFLAVYYCPSINC